MKCVLQQDEVLAELREYARTCPVPNDAPTVELVICYLTALNNLFEKSILGKHVRIYTAQGTAIQRMESAYQFFVDWAKEHESNDNPPSNFIAWQVGISPPPHTDTHTHTCTHTPTC